MYYPRDTEVAFGREGFAVLPQKKKQCVDCTNRNTKYGTSQFIC